MTITVEVTIFDKVEGLQDKTIFERAQAKIIVDALNPKAGLDFFMTSLPDLYEQALLRANTVAFELKGGI